MSNCVFDVVATNDPEVAKSSARMATGNSGFPPLNMTDILLQGEAKEENNTIMLTPNKVYLSGSAFRKTPVSGSFESEFVFNISTSVNGGGDGITFLIAKEVPELIPNTYPGRSGKNGYNGVKASLAVEFDTFPDSQYSENGNHVAIHTNGTEANSPHFDHRIAFNPNIIPLQDGTFHTGKVVYKDKKLTVYLDGLQVLETSIDLETKLGLNRDYFIGLVSSTSGSTNAHYLASWTTRKL